MKFMKWHGAGNDFILMKFEDLVHTEPDALSALAAKVCHRHFGIGADGLMVAFPSESADIQMVYYNSDGSYAAMCGNGIRCFSAFCIHEGLINKNTFTVETGDGIKTVQVESENGYRVTVSMGSAVTDFAQVPTTMPDNGLGQNRLTVNRETFTADVLKVGVPHTIIDLGERLFSDEDFKFYGPQIENMTVFPNRTNVNFVRLLEDGILRVDTWERGAGLTLACGTGVCASAYSWSRRGLINLPVTVEVAGGRLSIDLKGEQIIMTGPAALVARGEFY